MTNDRFIKLWKHFRRICCLSHASARHYSKSLLLREAAKQYAGGEEEASLAPEARERIKRAMEDHGKQSLSLKESK